MQQLLTGPYGARNLDRLAVAPPIGLTSKTGYYSNTSLFGPQISGTTERRILQFRDPVMPVWYDRVSSELAGQNWNVTYQTNSRTSTATVGGIPVSGTVTDMLLASNYGASTYVNYLGQATSIYTAMGQNFVPLMVDGKGGIPFVYVPANFKLNVIVWAQATATAQSWDGDIELEIWNAPGVYDAVDVTFATTLTSSTPFLWNGDALSAAAPGNVWVRPVAFTISGSAAGPAGVDYFVHLSVTPVVCTVTTSILPTLTIPGTTPTGYTLLPHPSFLPVPQATVAPITLNAVLPHSSHLTLENVTQVTSKEGIIQAARLGVLDGNVFNASSATMNNVAATKRYAGGAEHGLRSYVDPPAQLSAVRPATFVSNLYDIGAPAWRNFVMTLLPGDWFNFIIIQDPTPGSIGQFNASFSSGWEFLSQFQVFDQAVTKYTSLDTERACNALAARSPFSKFESGTVVSVTQKRARNLTSKPRRPRQNKSVPKPALNPKPKPPPPQAKSSPSPPPKRKGGLTMYLEQQRRK